MDQLEIYWRQYQLNIDTYRGYLDLVVKMNAFYYAVTGAIVSYYFAHQEDALMSWSLLLPLLMSVTLAIFFICGAFAASVTREETFSLRDKLGLEAAPEIAVLMVLLGISAFLMLLIAVSIGWLFLSVGIKY